MIRNVGGQLSIVMLMYVIFEELGVITFLDFFPEMFYLVLSVTMLNHYKTRLNLILCIILLLLLHLLVEQKWLLS